MIDVPALMADLEAARTEAELARALRAASAQLEHGCLTQHGRDVLGEAWDEAFSRWEKAIVYGKCRTARDPLS